jgi:hypothetical protein
MMLAMLAEEPTKQPGLRWPIPIDIRLDELVETANRSGLGTTRQELVTALVLEASPDVNKLRRAIVRLRTAKARDVLLNPDVARHVRGPGRPRRRRAVAGGSR